MLDASFSELVGYVFLFWFTGLGTGIVWSFFGRFIKRSTGARY